MINYIESNSLLSPNGTAFFHRSTCPMLRQETPAPLRSPGTHAEVETTYHAIALKPTTTGNPLESTWKPTRDGLQPYLDSPHSQFSTVRRYILVPSNLSGYHWPPGTFASRCAAVAERRAWSKAARHKCEVRREE